MLSFFKKNQTNEERYEFFSKITIIFGIFVALLCFMTLANYKGDFYPEGFATSVIAASIPLVGGFIIVLLIRIISILEEIKSK